MTLLSTLWRFLNPPDTNPRCRAVSGILSGYRCSLDKGHPLPHRSRYSQTRSGGEVVGYSEVIWPSDGPLSED